MYLAQPCEICLIYKTSWTRVRLPRFHALSYLTFTALRLYPSVPVNTRTAINATVLPTGGGPDRTSPVFIPKGAAIAYSVYSMHRRPDLYGMDAEIFRPERWDEEMPKDQNPTNARWGYLPFNGGPRICIGSKFDPPSWHFSLQSWIFGRRLAQTQT